MCPPDGHDALAVAGSLVDGGSRRLAPGPFGAEQGAARAGRRGGAVARLWPGRSLPWSARGEYRAGCCAGQAKKEARLMRAVKNPLGEA